MNLSDLLAIVKDYAPEDKETIIKAYEFASDAHKGVVRKSGEPYITHPTAVACILAEMHADVDTIVAGILHDVIEDIPDITKEIIAEKFNPTVANLVDGVTKLPKFSVGNSKTLTDDESAKKMFTSVAFDIRVLIIKLADRLHNMRTLEFHKPEKQIKISEETMNIFVPFASLIGAYTFKQELEDIAFSYLNPTEYLNIVNLENQMRIQNFDVIDQAICEVSHILNSKNIPFEMKMKVKNYYGLFKKLKKYNDITKVHDLFNLKFILPDEQTCYYIKDLVNSMYPYLQDKEKDFIKYPKTNMYRSLHTSVYLPNNQLLQFQIKTEEMYRINAYGLTAYWDLLKFDHAPEHMQQDVKKFPFFKLLDELVHEHISTEEFLKEVKKDILSKNIYVKTPKNEIIEIAEGATPIDLAFKIHTDLGMNIIGALVNGERVPLDRTLKSKDIVEIITTENLYGPRVDIYNMCTLSSTKRKIREHSKY